MKRCLILLMLLLLTCPALAEEAALPELFLPGANDMPEGTVTATADSDDVPAVGDSAIPPALVCTLMAAAGLTLAAERATRRGNCSGDREEC